MTLLTGLRSHWKLDETSGTSPDAHGSTSLAEINAVGSGTGKILGARVFVASNGGRLMAASNADLQMGDEDFSGAIWVKLASKSSRQGIMVKGVNGSGGEWWLEYDNSADRFIFYVCATSGFGGVTGATANTLGSPSTGTWYLLAGGHNATANETWISVDAGTPDTASFSSGVYAGTGNFELGSYSEFALNFDGTLDEASLWGRDVRADLSTLYNGGAGLPYSSFGGFGVTVTPAQLEMTLTLNDPVIMIENPLAIGQRLGGIRYV